jgi:uncharacterized protein YbjT (DUF2867 family)
MNRRFGEERLMILVTGASGTVGSEVLKQLALKGEKVRALVRVEDHARKIRHTGAEIFAGDLENPDDLVAPFQGIDKLFLSTPAHPNQLKRERNALEAAVRGGVKHIVKLSIMGADPESPHRLGRIHGSIEKIVEASGVPWTHLRTHFHMQHLFLYARPIRNTGSFFAPMKNNSISMVHVKDVAAVAATVLTEKGHTYRIYEITGPKAVTFGDFAAILSELTGEDIAYVDIPIGTAKGGLLEAGISEWYADALLEMFRSWGDGRASRVTNTVADVTGRWPTGLDKFLEENREVFIADTI